MMSLPTPAESTTMPTVVSSSLSSVRIRHRTGNAVMEYATPVNSMKLVNFTEESINVLYSGTASPAPKPGDDGYLDRVKILTQIVHVPKGIHIPANATVTERRALRLITAASISRPTRKRKRQRPIFATRERYERDSSGNMCLVNPGMRPNAVGPDHADDKFTG